MSKLRIISGKARGRRLKSVPGDTTRPITDRTKEALFNIISESIQGACLLDLFAGTGSVGIEALSRGAEYVRFIDINHLANKTIRANLETTDLLFDGNILRADIIQSNAFSYLTREADRKFDYIYIAPPQYKSLWEKTLLTLDNNLGWTSHDAWIIVQIDPVEFDDLDLNNMLLFDQRRYGSTLLLFYALTTHQNQG